MEAVWRKCDILQIEHRTIRSHCGLGNHPELEWSSCLLQLQGGAREQLEPAAHRRIHVWSTQFHLWRRERNPIQDCCVIDADQRTGRHWFRDDHREDSVTSEKHRIRSKFSRNDIVRITREMRAQDKKDEAIIKFLGLEGPLPWKQDIAYLKPLYAINTSAPPRESPKPLLTEEKQRDAVRNRDKW